MADSHKNFAYSTIATAPSPAASGTSLVVASGDGTKFPSVPFNATIWPSGSAPTAANAEIVRVTNISTDTFTITRTQESTSARTVIVGDQIAAAITAKTLTDIEDNYANSWSPFQLQTGSALQTLASNPTNITRTGSLYFFPITLQAPVRFNQILLANSLSYVTTSNSSAAAQYISKFGLYQRANATLFTLISSNSFSIGISDSSVSLSMNYPTTTHTSGYGYGSLGGTGISAVAQRSSLLDGTRVVGLQFGGEMSLSGARYWLALLTYKTTSNASTHGFSHAGIVGQVINPWNMPGTVSGPPQIGRSPTEFANLAFTDTMWYGRHIVGHLTNTARNDYAGTGIPPRIWINELQAATHTVLPLVTFVST